MHAPYVRVWTVSGLVALALAAIGAILGRPEHVILLGVSIAHLSLALTLGLLPAFARRDWPSPVFAIAAVSLAALAIPLARYDARAFAALAGASLVMGALQPLALLLSPRWLGARVDDAFTTGDRIALGATLASLVATLAGGALLMLLPRGLPNAALAALIPGAALPAAIAALAFVLPREARAPLSGATLFAAAVGLAWLAAGALAYAFARPVGADFRGPAVGLVAAIALGGASLWRARPNTPLLWGALALAVLASLGLLLATLDGRPNTLLPVAFYALAALALVLLAAALAAAAPILLPGKPRAGAWAKWAPALLIAALFLYTPTLQYARGTAPAAIVAALGVAALLWGLGPLVFTAPSQVRRGRRRR